MERSIAINRKIITRKLGYQMTETCVPRSLIILLASLLILCFSCGEKRILKPAGVNLYLHLSHTKTGANPSVDSPVERVYYDQFDMLWLGGDLAHLTSLDHETMSNIDSIFDLADENTLWSLGSHDYSDLERIQNFTNRQRYYAYHKQGITFIVLDTQENSSSIAGQQKALFDGVVDTLDQSSHLVLLHHKLIWMYGDTYLEPRIPMLSNGGLGTCDYCINPNNFYEEIYPKLVEVRQKGIEVLCIGGDIGKEVNEFEYLTPDGIYLLASGIEEGDQSSKALLFCHNTTTKSLVWEYQLLSSLY